jgi:response regulator RpfG family c-di-GMP phosphodiesterase
MKPQLRTAIVYVLVAGAWIWFSDRLLAWLVADPDLRVWLQSAKGWLFVATTGVVLYWMIGRDMRLLAVANRTLLEGHEQAMRALVSAMDVRHRETRDHTERVTRTTVALARLAGVEGAELQQLRLGALLHDIGKLALPDAVLTKPGKLDAEELELMRRHPQIAHDILDQVEFLRPSLAIPHAHHERWNGGGYPLGLRGEEIPLAARIFSVVDVWDALVSARVYKPAWPEHQVLPYLRDAAGTQFDPAIVALFLDHYDELKTVGQGAATAG